MYPKIPNKDEMISNIHNNQQNNHIQLKSHNHKNKQKYLCPKIPSQAEMISNIHNNQQNSHIQVIIDLHIHELSKQQIFKMIKPICKKKMSLPQNHYLVIFIVASHYNDIKEYILTYTNEYLMQIDVIASQLLLHRYVNQLTWPNPKLKNHIRIENI